MIGYEYSNGNELLSVSMMEPNTNSKRATNNITAKIKSFTVCAFVAYSFDAVVTLW